MPSPSGRGWSRSAGPGEGPALAIPLDETLPIAKQIAEGLEYAHERGVIHRDLKPANVKVRPDGTVKILDFGLAKALEETPAAGSINTSPTISAAASREGMILGTAAYMSPEQARGKTVDRRCDIWSFGVVLFEMLSGKQAFAGEDVSHTLAAVIMKEPDWNALPATTPAKIQGLVRRCLNKDPRQRLRDIGDARIAIEEALTGSPDVGAVREPPLQPASPPAWRRALPWKLLEIDTGWGPTWSRDGRYIYLDAISWETEPAFVRVRISDAKIEKVASLNDLRRANGPTGAWAGLTPDDAPLVLRDTGSQEIYALDVELP